MGSALSSRFQAETPRGFVDLRRESTRDLEKQAVISNYGTIAKLIHKEPVRDAMTYNTQELARWSSLVVLSFTVWNRKSLWMTAVKLWVLSLFVGIVVLATVRDPAQLNVSRFGEISSFLRMFVGLLLGFFMSASVNRWWKTVESFTALCGVVRKLQMMLNACGVPEQDSERVLRFGFLSARILHMELHIQALPLDEQDAAHEKRWQEFCNGDGFNTKFAKVLSDEEEALHWRKIEDAPGTLWIWIGSLLGRFAEKGLINTKVAGPAFARCMTLSGEGLDRILHVRSSITAQAPYIYVQMLSSLVHINNIFNALSFGMTTGVSFGTWLQYCGVPLYSNTTATSAQAAIDGQAFVVSFFSSCFGPFVYQALLEVSIAIAQPFSNNDAIVPTRSILYRLEQDLRDGMSTAKRIRNTRRTPSSEPSVRVPQSPAKNLDGDDAYDGGHGGCGSGAPRGFDGDGESISGLAAGVMFAAGVGGGYADDGEGGDGGAGDDGGD